MTALCAGFVGWTQMHRSSWSRARSSLQLTVDSTGLIGSFANNQPQCNTNSTPRVAQTPAHFAFVTKYFEIDITPMLHPRIDGDAPPVVALLWTSLHFRRYSKSRRYVS